MSSASGRNHHRRVGTAASAAILIASTTGIALGSSVLPAQAAPAPSASAPAAPSASATASAAPSAGHGPQRSAAPVGKAATKKPDAVRGTSYLVAPSRLTGGQYYESFDDFADYGLTLDGAFALAATGRDDAALKKIVAFLDRQGKDGSGRTVNDWTAVGTPFAGGGSIAKEALLAEVVGADPHAFGGHDLIGALDRTVCTKAGTAGCAAAGSYAYSPSVFSQALGVMAQLRAGGTATAPVAYLEDLQNADGSWPSLVPAAGSPEVDSTAMAVMALALVPGGTASTAVDKGIAWIAGQQETDGGFPGAAGDSTNSTALAVQGLGLDKAAHSAAITRALGFLAARQNGDGGFDIAAGGQSGSDVRASAQAVGGATGLSFGTLSHHLGGALGPSSSPTATTTASATPTTGTTPSVSTVPDGPGASDTASAPVLPGTLPGNGQLAATGSNARQEGLLAAALLTAGAAAVLATRRRRTADGRHR